MSVREVSFHIEFVGNTNDLIKANQAVDDLKAGFSAIGKAADDASDMAGKALKDTSADMLKVGKSAEVSKTQVISLRKDIAGFVAKSGVAKIGKAIKTNIGDALHNVGTKAKTAADKFNIFKNTAVGGFRDVAGKSRIAIGAWNDIKAASDKTTNAVKTKLNDLAKYAAENGKRIGESIGKGFEKAAAVTDKIGSTLTNKVTKPIIAAATGAVYFGMNYEQAMAEVKAISGASEEDFKALNAAARDVGANPLFSASEKAEGLKYMAMAGWDAGQSIAALPSILNLATASGENLGTVSDIVTDAMTAFKMTAEESSRFADVLAKASSVSNTNVGMMGDTFKYVAPVAGALGYSVEDTAIAVGLMANQGIKASQAGTALRASLASLADPSEETLSVMEELGISLTDDTGKMKPLSTLMGDLRKGFSDLSESEKAQTASMIFGREAMSGMLAIINSSEEDFNKVSGAIRNSKNSAEDMAAIMGNTMQGTLKEIKNTAMELGLQFFDTFGKDLKDVLTLAVDKLKEGMTAFKNMDEQSKKNIGKMLALGAAVGPVLKGFSLIFKFGSFLAPLFGKIAAAAGSGGLGGAAAALGIGLGPLVGIIAGVVAVGYMLYKNWDAVKAKGMEFIETIKGKFSEFAPHIQNIFSNVQIIFQAILPIMEGFFGGIGMMLGNLLVNFTDVIGGAIKIFSGLTDFLVGVFSGDWQKAWDGVKNIFSGIWDGISGIFKGGINFIIGGINSFISGINGIKIPDWVPGVGGKGINIPLIPTFAKGVKNFVGGAAIVGEEGPELVTLPRGSNVLPNRQTEVLGANVISFEKMLQERKNLSNAAMQGSITNTSTKSQSTYTFAPVIHIEAGNEKVADTVKDKIRELFDEFVKEEELVCG